MRDSSRRARRNRLMRRPSFEGLEARITLTTDVWTGAAALSNQDYSWSNQNNWSEGTPQSGEDLVFPGSGGVTYIPAHAVDNDLSGLTFGSIEIDGPGYTLGGDAVTLTGSPGIVTTYGSGVTTFDINTNLAGGAIDVASGGELDINGVISGSAGCVVSGGGILGGDGTLPGLAVEGSTVQPGIAGTGSLTLAGGASIDQASTFSVSVDGPGDASLLTGNEGPTSVVTLESPTLSVAIAPGYNPTPGSSFTIISGKVEGAFNSLPAGGEISAGGSMFRISYTSGVVLTAVQPTSVVTSVESGSQSSVFGQSVTFVATVTSPEGGTPTGSVTFDDGTTALATEPLSASGVVTFTTSALAVGQHAITSVYSGDADFYTSTAPVLEQTVSQADTTTTVTSSSNPSVVGEPIAITAAVTPDSPGAGVPTGTVTFYDGATELLAVPLTGGSATLTTSDLALGSHSITAQYSGDGNFTTSTSAPENQLVNQAGANTTLSSSANPSVFGQSVTFTAQVAAASPGAGMPTGSVAFFDGSSELESIPLDSGVAVYSTSSLTRGTHSITAQYSGDANFLADTSAVTSQAVNQATTSTVVTPSTAASILGQSVTFTAQVTPVSPGAGVPNGSVTFFDGPSPLETVTLDQGSASITTAALPLGSNSITAVYGGDGDDFLGSVSNPSVETVGGTTVALVASANPITFGQSVTFTATVAADAAGSTVPTGSVTFMDGSQSLGTFTIDSSGVASVSPPDLSGGTHVITAVYGGGTDFAPSTSSVTDLIVNPVTTTTTVSPSAKQSDFGETVTFTATVKGFVGSPTGSVTFTDGNKVVATVPVNASGVAAFSASTLAVGAHSLVATYGGTDSYFTSESAKLAFAVSQSATTTSLAVSSSTATVGQSVTFTATVAAVSPGAGAPTGIVVFEDGSSVIGTAAVSAGQATITVALSGVGKAQVIGASYEGSAGYASSASSGQSVTVVKATATTTLTATPDFVGRVARKVTLGVLLGPESSGGPAPTGFVTFDVGHRKLRTVPIVNGAASLVVAANRVAGKNVLVRYLGDVNYVAEFSTAIHVRSKFIKPKATVSEKS
jgi:hypothetical protein